MANQRGWSQRFETFTSGASRKGDYLEGKSLSKESVIWPGRIPEKNGGKKRKVKKRKLIKKSES